MERQSIEEVYFDAPNASQRYGKLVRKFKDHFKGDEPQFIARSPGRVNIIGDHVDYSYFPCLPAAIEFDLVMAVKVVTDPSDPAFHKVELVNTETEFAPHEFPADPNVKITDRNWANYFKCSWITCLKYLGITKPEDAKGLKIAVSGNVPVAGGLSSSAAFVVSGCMAVLKAHTTKFPLDKSGLVALSATCEQLVGVNSGGLDQSASVFGEKDHALLVSFKPKLDVKPMAFTNKEVPTTFLIANSLVVSAKLETAPIHYNLRVVEVTVAAQVLAKKLGIEIPMDGNLQGGTLYGVMVRLLNSEKPTILLMEKMLAEVENHLKKEPYTTEEAAEVLGISVEEFTKRFLTAFPVRYEGLKLYKRAHHVYTETLRVLAFVEAMQRGAHPKVLGDLMNESQASAETAYENSHPDCEKLCHIARKAGALGSRVTGAGWGGCTVHLVAIDKADAVRQALQKEYYDVHHPNAPKDALVETRPSSGSAMFSNVSDILKLADL